MSHSEYRPGCIADLISGTKTATADIRTDQAKKTAAVDIKTVRTKKTATVDIRTDRTKKTATVDIRTDRTKKTATADIRTDQAKKTAAADIKTDGAKKQPKSQIKKAKSRSMNMKKLSQLATKNENPPKAPGEQHPSLMAERLAEVEPRGRQAQKARIKQLKQLAKEKNVRSVFVGNLPKETTHTDLKKLFRKYGPIESMRFRSAAPANPKMPKKGVVAKKDFHSSMSSINAYIVFLEKSSAVEATACNGMEVKGQHIRVDQLDHAVPQDQKRAIFVGNLPFDAEEEKLRKLFEECGEVENVRIIRDKLSRIGKGFGYINFKEKECVLLALKLDGETFCGRKIRIATSKSSPTNKDPTKATKDTNRNLAKKRKRDGEESHNEKPVKKNKQNMSTQQIIKRQRKKNKRRIERKKKQNVANLLTGVKKGPKEVSSVKKGPHSDSAPTRSTGGNKIHTHKLGGKDSTKHSLGDKGTKKPRHIKRPKIHTNIASKIIPKGKKHQRFVD